MTSQNNKVLYIGVTSSLKRRIQEHFEGRGSIFTQKYNCKKLVYYEVLPSMDQAIVREKQLKHFMRKWKNELVESINPDWKDLAGEIIDNPDIVQIPGQAGDDNNIQAVDDDNVQAGDDNDGQTIGIRISGLRNRLRMGNGHYHDDTEAIVT